MHQKLSIKLFIAFGKLWYAEGFSDDLIIMWGKPVLKVFRKTERNLKEPFKSRIDHN